MSIGDDAIIKTTRGDSIGYTFDPLSAEDYNIRVESK